MTKLNLAYITTVCCIVSLLAGVGRADQAEDEAAIRKNDADYVEAYNKHDAKALAALWSPEAVYTDPETGDESVGREEIEQEFAATFGNIDNAKLEINAE